jgi:hypothetical protein
MSNRFYGVSKLAAKDLSIILRTLNEIGVTHVAPLFSSSLLATSKIKCFDDNFFFDVGIHIILSVLRAKHMDHGGQWPPMAAMVPTTRLRGVETLANMLCNKAM